MTPDAIIPAEGGIVRFSGESTFAASIELEPIMLPSEIPGVGLRPETTEVELASLRLPTSKLTSLANTSLGRWKLTFGTGFEGSVCLQTEHHPVKLLGLRFGTISNDRITATFTVGFDLYFCQPPKFSRDLKLDLTIEDQTSG